MPEEAGNNSKGLFSTITKTIQKGITDLTTLDTTTLIGDPLKIDLTTMLKKDLKELQNLQGVYAVGFTRLDIDGDIVELLHGDPATGEMNMDQKLLDIHKENVNTSIESWNSFFRNLLEIAATAAILVDFDPNKIAALQALKQNTEQTGK